MWNIWLSDGQACMEICLPCSQIWLSQASGQSLVSSPDCPTLRNGSPSVFRRPYIFTWFSYFYVSGKCKVKTGCPKEIFTCPMYQISTKSWYIWLFIGQVGMNICLPYAQIWLSRASGQSLVSSPVYPPGNQYLSPQSWQCHSWTKSIANIATGCNILQK